MLRGDLETRERQHALRSTESAERLHRARVSLNLRGGGQGSARAAAERSCVVPEQVTRDLLTARDECKTGFEQADAARERLQKLKSVCARKLAEKAAAAEAAAEATEAAAVDATRIEAAFANAEAAKALGDAGYVAVAAATVFEYDEATAPFHRRCLEFSAAKATPVGAARTIVAPPTRAKALQLEGGTLLPLARLVQAAWCANTAPELQNQLSLVKTAHANAAPELQKHETQKRLRRAIISLRATERAAEEATRAATDYVESAEIAAAQKLTDLASRLADPRAGYLRKGNVALAAGRLASPAESLEKAAADCEAAARSRSGDEKVAALTAVVQALGFFGDAKEAGTGRWPRRVTE